MSHGVLVWLPKTKQGFGRSIVLLRLFSKRDVFFLSRTGCSVRGRSIMLQMTKPSSPSNRTTNSCLHLFPLMASEKMAPHAPRSVPEVPKTSIFAR
jgi:hypothetical protein